MKRRETTKRQNKSNERQSCGNTVNVRMQILDVAAPNVWKSSIFKIFTNAICIKPGILTTYLFKATSWSTNDDITDAHISATIQQILTKFSAVVTYVK